MGVLNRFFSTTVDDEHLAQLVDMGFDVSLGKKALKNSGNDLDKALDLIRDETLLHKENYESSVSSKFLPHTSNKLIQMMLFISD